MMKIYRADEIVFKDKVYREDLYKERKRSVRGCSFWIDNGMIMILDDPARWNDGTGRYTPRYSCIPLDMVNDIVCCSVDAMLDTQQFDIWLKINELKPIWFDGRRLNHVR